MRCARKLRLLRSSHVARAPGLRGRAEVAPTSCMRDRLGLPMRALLFAGNTRPSGARIIRFAQTRHSTVLETRETGRAVELRSRLRPDARALEIYSTINIVIPFFIRPFSSKVYIA